MLSRRAAEATMNSRTVQCADHDHVRAVANAKDALAQQRRDFPVYERDYIRSAENAMLASRDFACADLAELATSMDITPSELIELRNERVEFSRSVTSRSVTGGYGYFFSASPITAVVGEWEESCG